MIFKNLSDLELELIVWADVIEHEETWASLDEIQEWLKDDAHFIVEQPGYVIAEDAECIVLASCFVESAEVFSNVHKIPKGLIKRRAKLIEHDQSTAFRPE